MKVCTKCGTEKSLTEFCKDRSSRDGLSCRCRFCAKVAKDAYRKANPTKDKEYSARKRAEDPAKKSADSLEYRLKYPKKVKAHRAINNGIRDGKVFKGSECEACGSTGLLNGHHDDYDKPFIVRWLCSPCHGAWHELNGEAANAT